MARVKLIIRILSLLLVRKCLGHDTSTLHLVHVVFRHGERTPDAICAAFWNDNDTYWPDGFGALTMQGKSQEYQIGTFIRERYSTWLGDIYYPELIEARSTDTSRAKSSLMLVLTGLFPPSYEQIWNWGIKWQPIPITFIPQSIDHILGYPSYYCPNFIQEMVKVSNSVEVQDLLATSEPIFDIILQNSKPVITSRFDNALFLTGCIKTWKEFKKPIPKWMDQIYGASLQHFAYRTYILNTYNSLLTKLSGGQLFRKILDDSEMKILGMIPWRKIFLYSGHEYNVAHLLRVLKSYTPHVPPYGSHLIFELHSKNGIFGFKIFYQNYESYELRPLIIPGCLEFCSLQLIRTLLADNIPDANSTC